MWSSQKGPTRLWHYQLIFIIISITMDIILAANEIWPVDRPDGMPTISSLEVMCGKDHMDVHLQFSAPFEGIVSSKGQHSDPRCIYVPPSSGKTFFAFRIAYARCGTKPDLNGQFYENTVVVQYDKDLLEVWDEAKRLRCEWFNDYEKTASKPPMVIADLDVIQLDFRGDNVDCWMEIQHGKGPWAPPVSGIVPLGSTLTLVVAINDFRGEFDMRVKSCVASDGGGHIIKLSDEYGCVLRPKMISRFIKARAPDEKASVITYAFFHAFKFPDALSVHIKCKVEICRHGCLDHCQPTGSNERNDIVEPEIHEKNHIGVHNSISEEDDDDDDDDNNNDDVSSDESNKRDSLFYDEVIRNVDELANIGLDKNSMEIPKQSHSEKPALQPLQPQQPQQSVNMQPPPAPPSPSITTQQQLLYSQQNPQRKHNHPPEVHEVNEDIVDEPPPNNKPMHEILRKTYLELKKTQDEKFPHGPRKLVKDRMGLPPQVAGPRSLNLGEHIRTTHVHNAQGNGSATGRRRRSVVISDRKARSADVGVSGIYDVISEVDLAFSPDTKQEAVTVFQGKISEEVVYGICLPVPGFSILFLLVTSAAVVAALVAGSLLYRYQLQKATFETQQQNVVDAAIANAAAAQHGHMNPNTFATWMTLRLFRMGQCDDSHNNINNHNNMSFSK